jgi:hypothetical protein
MQPSPQVPSSPWRVGRITTALGLVVFGAALLVDNLRIYPEATGLVMRIWPTLLIGFGLEYLVHTILSQRSGEDRRLRFDWGGAFLLTLIILLSAGITAARTWVDPTGLGLRIGIGTVQSRVREKSVSLGEAREIVANLRAGSVTVVESPTADQVRVEATYTAHGLFIDRARFEAAIDQVALDITQGEAIQIQSTLPPELQDVSVRYLIYAPPGLTVRTQTGAGWIQVDGYRGDLELSSQVGRISVTGHTGRVSIRSGSGTVSVEQSTGPVSVRTSVGSVHLAYVTGEVQVESGTGSVQIFEHRGGKLAAETRTGRIELRSSTILEGDVLLKTQTGSIQMEVPRESSMRISAQTRSGSITMPEFVTVTRNGPAVSATGATGDGKYTVTLEAGTGSIHLTAY